MKLFERREFCHERPTKQSGSGRACRTHRGFVEPGQAGYVAGKVPLSAAKLAAER